MVSDYESSISRMKLGHLIISNLHNINTWIPGLFLPSSGQMLAAMGRRVVLCCVLVVLGFALTCSAATLYIVGDSSGWDISTNLDTWANGKNFTVGDVLCKFVSFV